jgi:hypothetical protein
MEALWAKAAAPADGLVRDSRPRRGVPKPTPTRQEGKQLANTPSISSIKDYGIHKKYVDTIALIVRITMPQRERASFAVPAY